MREQNDERFMVIATISDAKFEDVRAGVLKVHGADACPMTDTNHCFGRLRTEDDAAVVLLISQYPGYVSVGCGYGRKRR